jgi:peptide/nickel transport system permease protein
MTSDLTAAMFPQPGRARPAARVPSRPGAVRRFARKPLAMISLCYLALVVIVTVLAPLVAPYGPSDQDLSATLSGPSSAHWLGTNQLGEDVLSRLIYGGRVTLLSVLITVAVYAAIGIPAGMLAGYRGGWFERVVLKAADLVFAIPGVIVLLVVLAIFPGNEPAAMAANGLIGAPQLARVVRSATLGVRVELYVRAAAAAGIGDLAIIRRHVLPRVTGVILAQASVFAASGVLLETGLGFLGLGNTNASWGELVTEASQNLGTDPWLLVPSGGIIITFILAMGLVGDGIRDALAESATGAAPRQRAVPAPRHSQDGTVPRQARRTAGTPGTPRAEGLLEVDGLTVSLLIDGTPTEVIRDVSFDLAPGEALGIVGESGCGKSVTAAALIGLLPEGGRVAAGSIWFDGADLARADPATLRRIRGRRIGWISQDPISSLDPSCTVGAQVAECVRVYTRCGRRAAWRHALELLERVRMPDPAGVAKSYPHQLSGGMAQRVGIAAALAGDPALIIADEPTTALDVTVQAEILDLLRELQRSGTAIILITHDWGVLADMCQRALVMYAGEVVEEADITALVAVPAHPYTAGLMKSDPHHGIPGKPLPALEGTVPSPAEWPAGCHFADRCVLATDACRATPVPLAVLADGARQARCLRTAELIGSTAGPSMGHMTERGARHDR